jgi:hypothetical protein
MDADVPSPDAASRTLEEYFRGVGDESGFGDDVTGRFAALIAEIWASEEEDESTTKGRVEEDRGAPSRMTEMRFLPRVTTERRGWGAGAGAGAGTGDADVELEARLGVRDAEADAEDDGNPSLSALASRPGEMETSELEIAASGLAVPPRRGEKERERRGPDVIGRCPAPTPADAADRPSGISPMRDPRPMVTKPFDGPGDLRTASPSAEAPASPASAAEAEKTEGEGEGGAG